MDTAEILRNLLIVLVAAKLAAEVSERIGIPAVVGEIIAGIIIGPSLLNAVGEGDEVLRTLGEIGVILLLLDVGLEMDLKELGKVGRTSLQVATIGVVAPLVLGLAAMSIMGEEFNTALFVGAALTATSVGITARVFGDLRALATHEARVVLGAAVADDVMGLVVLTVVVRLVTEGSVSLLSVLGIIAVAVLFLALGSVVGLRVAPPLFSAIDRVSRSPGTVVAIAFAFTLAFAELADLAQLAPIVGAFVAGIALSKADQSERIRRDLTPVGHLFIPVFFLQIGIDADITSFGSGEVLRDAGILLVVAVVGKLLSPLGAIGAPGDKPLIGLGMLPRGEVGLDLRDHRAAERGARRRPLRRAPPRRARHDAGHPAAAEGPVPPPPGRREARRHAQRHPAPRGRVAAGGHRRRGVGGPPARRAGRPARARRGDLPRPPATGPGAPRLAHGRRAPDERVERPAHLHVPRRHRARERALVAVPRDHRCARRRAPRAGPRLPSPGRRHLLPRRLGRPRAADDAAPAPARRGRPALDRGAGAA